MVVLATKLYVAGDARDRALDSLTSLVENAVGDLEVTTDVGVRTDDFPTVSVEGPDATAARNVLEAEFGALVPDLVAGDTYRAPLQRWDEDGFVLDGGFDNAVQIPADEFDLGPGSPAQIRTRFGLVQHLQLSFVAGDPCRLADVERDRLYGWLRGPGRVTVNSATRAEVRATLNRAGHADDVVTVERLGLLEQSIVCAEGTDPPGLLASVGRYLPSELLCVVP